MITRPVVPTLATAPTKNQLLGQFLAASSERRANWPQGSTVVRIEGFAGDGFQQVTQRAIHPVPGKERRRICVRETLPWPVAVPTAPATPRMAHGFPARLAPVFRYRHVLLSSDGAGSPRDYRIGETEPRFVWWSDVCAARTRRARKVVERTDHATLLDARVVRLAGLWRRHFGGSIPTVARR